MNNKNAKTAKTLTKIGGFMCLIVSVFMLVLSMFTPIEVTINDTYTRGTLWELSAYPAALSFWLGVIIALMIFGIIGLLISKKVQQKATTTQGWILIIIGFPSFMAMGAGILFIIAGVQTFLAKKVQELTA
ncbi:hypothetical protein KFZ56_04510 [Virgibacillus sp. NKC19-3]|uniref:hypothetical protein n=1 Tax=Virgibacillus saliphilus TaxID=2831674 RepID=UPI001C9ACF24|nr:hypothetical protein [Virgibacillus sp. NKC19-3]MBY7142367.1 hypothetical protein [Virgibacillus sp. NKC19-3]